MLDDSGTLIISGDGDMNKIQLNSDAFVWVKYKTEVQAVVLKEGVTNIGNYAFAHCTNLQEVTIPDTVTSIGRFAFADCPKLKRIFIPESVISIADDAFVQELVSSPDRKDLVIAGVSGSYAEQFAKGHRITFEDETGTLSGISVSYRKKIEQIVVEQVKPGMSEKKKAKALHDWIVYHSHYEYTDGDKMSLILDETGGTCGEYAQAYSDLLTAAGIENMLVWGYGQGDAHYWNLVRIDGQWYHVDTTFDDPGTSRKNRSGNERSKYFMLTDEQMRKDHQWDEAGISAPDPF